MGVDAERVVGRVDVALLVVLLTQGKGAPIHLLVVYVRIAAHCGLRQCQVLERGVNKGGGREMRTTQGSETAEDGQRSTKRR